MEKINIFKSKRELNEEITDFILHLLFGDSMLTICLSGGSTPKSLFDYWAENYKTKIPWNRISFYWGDERCVPPSDEMSNYGMTKKHLLDKIDIPEKNIFHMRGEDDPEEEALRYSQIIPEKFDLVLLGLGEDGHTASIFPHNIKLWDSPQKCVVSAHPDTGMKRISITGRVINTAENVAFLIAGKNKEKKINQLLYHRADFVDKYPAARVNPDSGNLYYFLQ